MYELLPEEWDFPYSSEALEVVVEDIILFPFP